jgi:peptidoglycan/LPS O-acetylase OafA/YrhL
MASEPWPYSELIRGWSPGMIGVRTFFVLSGFLITSILLQQRGTASGGDLAGQFFLRRFLRLAPPFYLAIALATALGISGMQTDWWVHALYLSNIQIALQQQWSGAGHFWTLAVEEQFYLLWFPAVILAPRRWLLPICMACLIAAPLFRSLILLDASPFIDVLLPSQLDSLSIGALLAIIIRNPSLAQVDAFFLSRRVFMVLAVFLVVLSAPWLHDVVPMPLMLRWVLLPLIVSLCAACIVRQCVAAEGHSLGWLKHPALVHVGKISYGLYVFHYFVPPALYEHVPAILHLTEGPLKLVRTLLWVLISFALAELSWRLIEKPLMRRRRGLSGKAAPALLPDQLG